MAATDPTLALRSESRQQETTMTATDPQVALRSESGQEETMMTATDPQVALPLNLHEYETAARELLPPMVVAFVAGGSGDEVTLRGNRAAFDRWRLLPRMLRGLREVSTATSVLGQEIALPVLIAPSSLHRLCHDEGERATARAAKAAGTIYTLSTPASIALEEVAPEAGPWWFQLYVFQDRELTRDLVARAASAGASALVVTVDMPTLGRREADERHRFTLPPGVTMPHIQLPAPRLPTEAGARAKWTTAVPMVESALTWDDLDWLASLSSLPVIPKGILHPDDAVRAIDRGARAVIVSNHGGRQLDSAVAPSMPSPRWWRRWPVGLRCSSMVGFAAGRMC